MNERTKKIGEKFAEEITTTFNQKRSWHHDAATNGADSAADMNVFENEMKLQGNCGVTAHNLPTMQHDDQSLLEYFIQHLMA